MNRVKIIATIGPRTMEAAALRALHDAGMDVARLNGSHADLAWHEQVIGRLRAVIPDVPVLLDIPGRKVRTAQLQHEPTFVAGESITLTTEDGHDGRVKVPVTHPGLHNVLAAGDMILADDGSLAFTVVEVMGRDMICRAETSGTLRSAKGISLPGVMLSTESLSERDRRMLAFAQRNGVDYVGLSFVESASHVKTVRETIGVGGPRIVSKVESRGALDHLREIFEASDAVMIDRGDLSVETNLESITLLQKRILTEGRRLAKPGIVATEMLHSMVENASPTRAEVSDISNAVLDGAAALMLSGETAVGRFPVEAVTIMRRIADTVSEHLQSQLDGDTVRGAESVPAAMKDAIALICRSLPITKIVAITISGYAARMVSAVMPSQSILAVSNDPVGARSFNLLRGTEGVFVDVPFSRTSTDHIPSCLEALWRADKLVDDDVILVTAVGYPRSGNRMNLIETHKVADLRDNLGWTR